MEQHPRRKPTVRLDIAQKAARTIQEFYQTKKKTQVNVVDNGSKA